MIEENELAKLEGFVSTLLEKYNGLQADNKTLTGRLDRRDASIVSLEDEIASMKDARGEVSERVSGLINKIEEWEVATADVEASVDDEEEQDETAPDSEAEEAKKESGVQGNLFSADAANE